MSGHARIARWLDPLPGESAVGDDARYDPAHERVRQEVAKLEAPTGAGVEWSQVVEVGGDLLAGRAKDFLIACYVCGGLLESEGPAGLCAGLELLCGLTERYWEAMYPPVGRPRARSAALQWLMDRIELRLSDIESLDVSVHECLSTQLARLRSLVGERLPEHLPAFQPALDACARIATTSGQAAPAQETRPPSAPTPEPSTLPGPGVHPSVDEVAAATPRSGAQVSDLQAQGHASDDAGPADAWLQPISAEFPAGQDGRYEDPVHEQLRTEVAQLDTPSGGSPDWSRVAELGGQMLQRRSKDLLIALYVAEAWRVLDGLPGLERGFALVTGLLERFSDDMFPSRARGDRARASALAWWLRRLEQMGEVGAKVADRSSVEALESSFEAMAKAIGTHIDPQSRPAMGTVREQIARLKLDCPAPAQESAKATELAPAPATPSAKAPEPPSAAAPPLPAARIASPPVPTADTEAPGEDASPPHEPAALVPPRDVSNSEAVAAFLLKIREVLLELAHAFRAREPGAARAYRLLRTAAYLRFFELPPLADNGRTHVRLPVGLDKLEEMLAAGDHAALLDFCERGAATTPLCLDFHYFSWVALDRLGEEHRPARDAVLAAARAITTAFPGLTALETADGRPLAGEACKQWLQAQGPTSVPSTDLPVQRVDQSPDLPMDATSVHRELADARALVNEGKVADGIAAFQACINSVRSGRERFLARTVMAEAVAPAKPAVAMALYAGLLDEIDSQRLETWEPELASRCLSGFYGMLKAAKGQDPEMATTAAVVYRRLCRLDPVRGLTVSE